MERRALQPVVKELRVAIAGNPNVGKSTLFNELTGGRAWVGNWPGVTVEKKVGRIRVDGRYLEIVDLPGIYGLTAYGVDELIARNFIVEENPDVVVNIVNAANLERNLYLTVSLIEMGANVVVCLNMVDLAADQGYEVNSEKLSQMLGVPVIPTIAVEGRGIEELKKAIVEAAERKEKPASLVNYGSKVESEIGRLSRIVEKDLELARKYNSRWVAIKLLEGDSDVEDKIKLSPLSREILSQAAEAREKLESSLGRDVESYIVEKRYEFVSQLVEKCVGVLARKPITLTDMVDYVVTHKVFGIPIMLTALYVAFKFAFDVAAPLCDLIDWFFSCFLYDLAATIPGLAGSLLADGIITGVGSILVFVPNLAFIFLFLALLEDVGYMARAAFVVDKIMHKLHLTGKSLLPLILGFGCNLPGIIATRAIEDENDRKTTALVCPLISCSARLPVYLVIAGALFSAYVAGVVWSMYILGVIFALIMATLLRKLLFKGPSSGFIMELPPYMKPMLKSVGIKTWERLKRFLFKAGTIIFAGVVVVWLLSITGPSGYLGVEALEEATLLEQSWIGIIGHGLEKIFTPMGWGWQASAALFFGFIAKEIVVGSMAVLFGVSEEGLIGAVSGAFTPLTAYAYMAFVLLYLPCLATLAIIRGELGLKYALFTAAYEFILAYFVAFLIVSIGTLLGLGG
ncbi:MAG: ferrous iron transport protein B [Candidatus Hecatellales archaeon]|nr:MAG: ferrous iron transport protein B [Candidatus Hecatellales archaeon]